MELERITKRLVDTLKAGDRITDSEVRGFRARCWDSGRVSFEYRYRNSRGERRSLPLGMFGEITADQARAEAQKAAGAVAAGRDPAAERTQKRARSENTVNAVLDRFIEEYAQKRVKRPQEVARTLERLVRPSIGSKAIYDVTRKDITDILRTVAKETPTTANRVLAYTRKAFNWYAVQDDKFKTPIVIGMAPHKEKKRQRILSDDELRDIVAAADALSTGKDGDCPAFYGDIIRVLLFSAQRIGNVSRAHAKEFSRDGSEWTILIKDTRQSDPRPHLVPLTDDLRALLVGDPPDGKRKGFVFATDTGEAFDNYSRAKLRLDRKIAELRKAKRAEPMPHWTYHDLRRTSRTRIGNYITSDIAERVVGHTVPGVRGVYDLNEYKAQKREGLEKLAAEYRHVLSPELPPDNVVKLRRSAAARTSLRRVAG